MSQTLRRSALGSSGRTYGALLSSPKLKQIKHLQALGNKLASLRREQRQYPAKTAEGYPHPGYEACRSAIKVLAEKIHAVSVRVPELEDKRADLNLPFGADLAPVLTHR